MNILSEQTFWILSGLILFVIAWVQFNTPPTNRSSTTFLLFYSGVAFYYSLLVALWLIVVLILHGTGAGLSGVGLAISSSLKTNKELAGVVPFVAVLMIAVASRFKSLRNIDTTARSLCIALAAIPRQADDLATELAKRAEFRVVDLRLKKDISDEIKGTIGSAALSFEDDATIPSRLPRAVALYWLFVIPFDPGRQFGFPTNAAAQSTYTRIMRLNDRIVVNARAVYDSLIEASHEYFSITTKTRKMEERVTHRTQELSLLVCNLIARYVLSNNITVGQRRRRLARMGFVNFEDHPSAFSRDQWIATIVAIIILFALLSVVVPGGQPFPLLLLYSVLGAVQLGIASIAGTVVAQRFVRRDRAQSLRIPPFGELLIAVLVVVALCVALRISWFLVPMFIKNGQIDLQRSIDIFVERWPFLLNPIACTITIGVLCSYLGNSSWSRTRLSTLGGTLNGVAFALTGLLMSQLLPEAFMPHFKSHPEWTDVVVMGMNGAAGAVLGAIILAIFPRSVGQERGVIEEIGSIRSGVDGSSLLGSPTQKRSSAITAGMGAVSALEIGGYTEEAAKELEGRYVCFRPSFSDAGTITAYLVIIRWDETHVCLTFEEHSRPDGAHTQRGMVYLPNGKPFLSLMTIDKGSVRLLMVCRPVEGIARGVILTLSTPRGTHFIPVAAPVVLRRLGEETPTLGFVRPDMPDYNLYYVQLTSVVPDFGNFVFPALDPAGRAGPGRSEGQDPARPRRASRANKEARSPAS